MRYCCFLWLVYTHISVHRIQVKCIISTTIYCWRGCLPCPVVHLLIVCCCLAIQCRLSRNLCPCPFIPLLLWCSNYNQITLIRTDIIPQWFRILWDTVYPFASVVGINGLTCFPAGLFLLENVKRLDTCHEK